MGAVVTKVFVSGCYDILHGGHIQFFEDARALGDHLTVCYARDTTLSTYKNRPSAMPDAHKQIILESLRMVDRVYCGRDMIRGLDFIEYFTRGNYDILAVTSDDKYSDAKRTLCEATGAKYVVLPKRSAVEPTSTTDIRRRISAPMQVPLRVDFAGGWLDVPDKALSHGLVVNCAITPMVSWDHWPYEKGAGLGGSAAWAILNGLSGIDSELKMGVGWQDPAIVRETGLCVWKSGDLPVLSRKHNPNWLEGKMALLWTGKDHYSPDLLGMPRDYDAIARASRVAAQAADDQDLDRLADAVGLSYHVQLDEGMEPLPDEGYVMARKYCGSGHGGYALYLFENDKCREFFTGYHKNAMAIEPYLENPR
jgi:cytidyltransferase-like protein